MRNLISSLLVSSSLLLCAPPLLATMPVVDHDLRVQIDPPQGRLVVTAEITLPDDRTEWPLLLHTGLDPSILSGNAELRRVGEQGHLALYRLLRQGPGPMTLSYGGRIQHPREQIDEGMGRAREWSRGTIDAEGVFLAGGSGWYPRIPETLQTFHLEVSLPTGWTAVSQGAGPGDLSAGRSIWTERQPQDDIYLIAAPFERYAETAAGFEAQVYLREPDAALAQRYLDVTRFYIDLYSNLIGPYPYAKFALVENFWETGYGMPSFTLLGPRVIRLPFILHTSYPHEILHNWWGNSVYVDYSTGNWSEGLTSYLADHLVRERVGEGWRYRRDLLKSYADYVRESSDFPLVEFHARHGAASQAIGYGKAAMLFHMLRRQLGDETFRAGLQRFYADQRFRVAGFPDLQVAFDAVSNQDLADFFATWTQRTGAASLRLTEVMVSPEGSDFRVRGRIEQIQDGPPFDLQVPVVVRLDGADPVVFLVALTTESTAFEVSVAQPPLQILVDPWFDLFRTLAPGETPVTLSNLFGSERGIIVLPANAPDALKTGYQQLADAWLSGQTGWTRHWDDTLSTLPTEGAIWLLGWENRWLNALQDAARGVDLTPATHRIAFHDQDQDFGADASPVLTAWHQQGQALGWLAAPMPEALPGLTRKLPRYGKSSYLVFTGQEPTQQLEGQWPPADSELIYWIGPERPLPALPEPPALVP
ncbi:peptidase M28 [Thiocapsa imhoffii]|uniref:Peptidase M28 n=1 Tax=Thiocapsa imhoffii TaxID=382777 RepID=A0A9X0WGK6_9GAMM|nr:M1 family aminopeptidase [Thiocapsa imhoffii]MBK1644110.1 peptidase M28 [Thiocapsa imhoffii]